MFEFILKKAHFDSYLYTKGLVPSQFNVQTRMKTSINSKAFVALPTDRRTKYLQNRCSFMREICIKKLERYLN